MCLSTWHLQAAPKKAPTLSSTYQHPPITNALASRNTLRPVKKDLRDSSIDNGNVHETVLVGSSTRIRRIV
jgi:hypothetical protein